MQVVGAGRSQRRNNHMRKAIVGLTALVPNNGARMEVTKIAGSSSTAHITG